MFGQDQGKSESQEEKQLQNIGSRFLLPAYKQLKWCFSTVEQLVTKSAGNI